MINKIKYIFLLFLCAAVIGGAAAATNVSAQTNSRVLVSAGGKTLRQSDVDKMIEFYEWAFEAKFNSTQRADFQEYTESEFRANPSESRKTIDDIVTTFPKIQAASEDVQAATRKNFLEIFLPEARRSNDANSQMLLSIYEAANGSTRSENVASNEAQNTQNDNNDSYETVRQVGVGDLSAIVGKWVSGSSGSMTTTTSGAYLGGNASRHTYQFSANGAVEYTGIMNIMTGGCRMQIFKTAKGRATLRGDLLTINWSPASFSRDNSCSPSQNYKKTLPAETETFKIAFETFYDDKQLCLTSSDKTCFSRD